MILLTDVHFPQRVEDLTPLANASAGFFAAFFSSLTLCPTELVKCRLQALQETQSLNSQQTKVGITSSVIILMLFNCTNEYGFLHFLIKGKSVGPWTITRDIIKNEGFKGMFRGLVPTFAREMPGSLLLTQCFLFKCSLF